MMEDGYVRRGKGSNKKKQLDTLNIIRGVKAKTETINCTQFKAQAYVLG